jgi:DNA-binding transcriptional LysR family regulator
VEIARTVLLPALPQFLSRYPDIQIDMGVSDRSIDLIGENVDCVVRVGEVTDQSLVARRIGDLSFLLCAAPSYIKQFGVPEHPRELADSDHRIVGHLSPRTAKAMPYVMHRGDETVEVLGRYSVAVNDGDGLLVAGLAGMGVIRLTDFMAAPHVRDGALQPMLSDWTFDRRPIYVAFPPNRHVTARLRAFVDWVSEQMDLHGRLAAAPQQRSEEGGQA